MICVMECPFCGKLFKPRQPWGSCEFREWLAEIGQEIEEDYNRVTGKWRCPDCSKQWNNAGEGLPMRWIE